jgi:hypothetical protein
MSPETELLLACVAPQDAEPERLASLMRSGVNWDRLLPAASHHGVTPLLYRRLNSLGGAELPPGVQNELRNRYLDNARRSLTLTGALLKLLEALEERGVQPMVLRGPVLGASLYGNVALRQIADLDILVSRPDVPAAADVLAACGFRHPNPFTATQQALTLRTDYNFHLERADGVAFELHWRLMPGFFSWDYDPSEWWARAITTPFCEREVLEPSPEDLLLMLCVHGLKHGWEQLRLVADVAWLVQNRGVDWDQAIWSATRTGVARALNLGCRLATDLLGAPVPKGIIRRAVADKAADALALAVVADYRQSAGRAHGYLSRSLLHLRARERWRDRMRYCFRVFCIPTVNDYAVLRLPLGLSLLYYPIRTGRMIVRYGLEPLRRLVGGSGTQTWPHAGPA